MLIEYKIKFEKNGVTITQRVEPGSPGTIAPPRPHLSLVSPAGSKQLGDSFPAAATVSSAKPVVGTGDVAPTDTGEGNPPGKGVGSGLTIVFGPVIMAGTALGDTGGGDVAPTDTGENPQ